MLIHKQTEEPLTHKILFLGTMLVFVFFLIKYLKRMSQSTCIRDSSISESIRASSGTTVKPRPPSPYKEDKRSKRGQVKRRRSNFYEEWVPKDVVGTYNAKQCT